MDAPPSLGKVPKRTTLVDEAADRLRSAIVQGQIPAGSPLVESDLADELGISRTPLREALQRLRFEGLLVRNESRGLRVADLQRQELADLYLVREVVDGLAARLAAERATESELAALRAALDRMYGALDPWNPHGWLVEHLAFHEQVVHAAHSAALQQFVAVVHNSIKAFYPSVLLRPERSRIASQQHAEILAAIQERDPDRAEKAGRHHIESARHLLRELESSEAVQVE